MKSTSSNPSTFSRWNVTEGKSVILIDIQKHMSQVQPVSLRTIPMVTLQGQPKPFLKMSGSTDSGFTMIFNDDFFKVVFLNFSK